MMSKNNEIRCVTDVTTLVDLWSNENLKLRNLIESMIYRVWAKLSKEFNLLLVCGCLQYSVRSFT